MMISRTLASPRWPVQASGLQGLTHAGGSTPLTPARDTATVTKTTVSTATARKPAARAEHGETSPSPSSGKTSGKGRVRAHREPLWKRIAHYVLNSTHVVVEALEAAHVVAGLAIGGAVGAGIVSVGMTSLGASQLINGVRDKSGEEVVEGAGGVLVGAKSGLEMIALSGARESSALHSLAHDIHPWLAPLGVAHGTLEVALGARRIYTGVRDGQLGKTFSGLLTIGLGASVCAASLGGGLPAVVASGLFLAGRIGWEEAAKVSSAGPGLNAHLHGPKAWRLLN